MTSGYKLTHLLATIKNGSGKQPTLAPSERARKELAQQCITNRCRRVGEEVNRPGPGSGGQASAFYQGQVAVSLGTTPTSSRKLENGPMFFMASHFGPENFRHIKDTAFMGPYSPAPISIQREVLACIR